MTTRLRRRAAAGASVLILTVLLPGLSGHPAGAVSGDTITDPSGDAPGGLDIVQATRSFAGGNTTITITTASSFTDSQTEFLAWMDLNGDGLADDWILAGYDPNSQTVVGAFGPAGTFHLASQGVTVSRPSNTSVAVTFPSSYINGSTTFDWAVMSVAPPATTNGQAVIDLAPDQPTAGLALPTRIAGASRDETAVQSSFFLDGSADAVVLARSDAYPDALGGAPLAAAKNGPLLLTPPTSLDGATLAEIQRVLPKGRTVYLLGGLSALSQSVEDAVKAAGYNTVRYGGQDRYATALLIVQQGLGNPSTILLTTGTNFPDALPAGAAAANKSGGVLLTSGSTMPSSVGSYLAAHGSDTVYAIGGPAAAADPQATPVVGADRYDTSAKVAQTFFSTPDAFGVASGLNYPDALAGGATMGEGGGPLLLTDPNSLPAPVQAYLKSNTANWSFGYVFGGSAAVSDAVASAVSTAALG